MIPNSGEGTEKPDFSYVAHDNTKRYNNSGNYFDSFYFKNLTN